MAGCGNGVAEEEEDKQKKKEKKGGRERERKKWGLLPLVSLEKILKGVTERAGKWSSTSKKQRDKEGNAHYWPPTIPRALPLLYLL